MTLLNRDIDPFSFRTARQPAVVAPSLCSFPGPCSSVAFCTPSDSAIASRKPTDLVSSSPRGEQPHSSPAGLTNFFFLPCCALSYLRVHMPCNYGIC